MLVFDPELDAGTAGDFHQPEQFLGHAFQTLRFSGIWLPQKSENAEKLGIEFTRHLEAALEDVAVFADSVRILDLAFEHRRGAADDFPALVARHRTDGCDVLVRQILEGTSVQTAELDAGQLELANEAANDGEIL